jgi:NitT/TauT family transport system substrate-binding protein
MPKIRLIENFRALFYAPFYAAHATGAYAKHGLDVEILPSQSPLEAAAKLRNGEADVMWGGPLRVLLTLQADQHSGIVAFANVVERDPFLLLARTPNLTRAEIATQRLAAVSEVPTPWLCLQDDFRRAGIRVPAPRTDLTMPQSAAALLAGEVDVAQLYQPYAEQSVRAGAHIVYAAATRGLTAYTTLVTTRATIASRRDELRLMTSAIAETLLWFAATPAPEIARALQPYFPALDQDLFAACIARYRALNLWATSPVIPREGFARLHAAMRSGGALHADIAFEAAIDNSLA